MQSSSTDFHQYDGLAMDMNETDTLTNMEIHID